ncbi:hypothetical protein D3C73_1031540 [compost metagenome]
MMAGGAPKNLMPSAPRAASLRTHSRPCSGVWMVLTRSFTAGNTECTTMRGAAILLAAESSRCSIVQPRPPIAPISRTVVTPCASHSL